MKKGRIERANAARKSFQKGKKGGAMEEAYLDTIPSYHSTTHKLLHIGEKRQESGRKHPQRGGGENFDIGGSQEASLGVKTEKEG